MAREKVEITHKCGHVSAVEIRYDGRSPADRAAKIEYARWHAAGVLCDACCERALQRLVRQQRVRLRRLFGRPVQMPETHRPDWRLLGRAARFAASLARAGLRPKIRLSASSESTYICWRRGGRHYKARYSRSNAELRGRRAKMSRIRTPRQPVAELVWRAIPASQDSAVSPLELADRTGAPLASVRRYLSVWWRSGALERIPDRNQFRYWRVASKRPPLF